MSERSFPRQHAPRVASLRRGLAFILSLMLTLAAFPPTQARVQEASADGGSKARPSRVEFVPGEVLVRFRPGSAAAEARADARSRLVDLRDIGGREMMADIEQVDGFQIVEGLRLARVAPEDTLKAIAALNEQPDVLYAEPNYVWRKEQATLSPNDPQYSNLWGLKNTGQTGHNDVNNTDGPGVVGNDIKAEQAWGSFTTGSKNVIVAVIDEGIDINHPDLKDNIWTNPGEVPGDGIDNDGDGLIDDVNGWDFVHNDKTVFDYTGTSYPPASTYTGDTDDHGTHVAGTIGARGNNGVGLTGVNWQVSILPVKVLGADGGSTANIIKGYNYVKTLKDRGVNVRVTNNSYGGPGFSQSAFNAISALNDSGILFVVAGGNETEDSKEFSHYPSDYNLPNVISVAAIDRFEQLAVFSNFGPGTIHVAAPGRGIYSTTPISTYSFFSGTSMATPHVAGAAALCLAAFPNVSMTALRNALILSGDPLASLDGKVYSQRRLNVYKALQTLAKNDQTPPASVNNLHITGQNGRAVTLSWTAPGDDGTGGGPAALYVFQADSTFIGTKVPGAPGTTESVTLNVPYHQATTQLIMRVRDAAGWDVGGGLVSVTSPLSVVEPYTVTESAAEPLTAAGSGTALGISGDDTFKENVTLPFTFPFYGQAWTTVTVSSNGAIYFSRLGRDEDSSGQTFGLDAFSSVSEMTRHKMIAGMWDDLDTSTGNVYMVQPDANRVIFRWEGVAFDNKQPISFETELRRDGTIINRYGAGNTGLFPTVGISPGEPVPYSVPSHISQRGLTSRINLTSAQTVTFAPRASNVPPTVSITSPYAGRTFVAPASVQLTAAAADADGSVSNIQFFVNGTLVGTAIPPNTTVTAPISSPGTYTATAVATDNSGATATSAPVSFTVSGNQVDSSDFFVRQHYLDFFGRQADAPGLQFWTNNIDSCASASCIEVKRIDTSAAFFLSIEFQQTGYLVYRAYKAAYGNLPNKAVPLTFAEFLPDTSAIDSNVVVGQTGWEQVLETNKQNYFNSFVSTPRFQQAYPSSMTPAQFVDKLNTNAGNVLSQTERDTLVNALTNGTQTRAQVVRAVAEDADMQRQEFNRAFVLMQYFGYLRRDADDAGYQFWLQKLNNFNGDFRAAEMVKAFITSGEYRARFGTP